MKITQAIISIIFINHQLYLEVDNHGNKVKYELPTFTTLDAINVDEKNISDNKKNLNKEYYDYLKELLKEKNIENIKSLGEICIGHNSSNEIRYDIRLVVIDDSKKKVDKIPLIKIDYNGLNKLISESKIQDAISLAALNLFKVKELA